MQLQHCSNFIPAILHSLDLLRYPRPVLACCRLAAAAFLWPFPTRRLFHSIVLRDNDCCIRSVNRQSDSFK